MAHKSLKTDAERMKDAFKPWAIRPHVNRAEIEGVLVSETYLVEKVLRPMCESETQQDVAKRLGYSKAFVCDVLAAYRGVSADFAKALGYERVVGFRKISL